ncbi:hypothetical protein P175DRAFT_0531825 [Aspergillus ochraceoroseus IBT 24754]|uniref:Uncharacterized protein n=1 Tax=Aspergillus ochraceoroseus IBT 24754 TaxID=1392256 RepID=A0A2T5LW30_9EURO|nr:uncharacterized protein P175DRAFT_0531825 [Aspergillus ochraceoroseus IBT 24754]PTU20488.1 hypothetical protein P175DRAFT_0531825 [Aspergillus ochraceoroseus IBT 24754]
MTNTPLPHLQRFQQVLESLYGDFSAIRNPEQWTPPANSGGHRGRYLWTDAFGLLNLVTLHQETRRSNPDANNPYLVLARRLAETVHDVLGHTRDGASRLPGASDANPLGGGLRIGKVNEYGSDGDGQYHHYLTLWMFALNRLSLATGDPAYNQQAIALARAIHRPFFINRGSDRPRMVWKMDVNLSRPLVASEGNLDPIDGFVVFRLLQATAAATMHDGDGDGDGDGRESVLTEEIQDYHRVMKRKGDHFVSGDPLDLGMTLWTAHWFAEKEEWATRLVDRCFEQIYDLFEINRYLDRNIKYRLAFREFGTCMGIRCMSGQDSEMERSVDLKVYSDRILAAWGPYMDLALRTDVTPEDLRPITRVMYAAAMIPGAFQRGYLGPEPESSVH